MSRTLVAFVFILCASVVARAQAPASPAAPAAAPLDPASVAAVDEKLKAVRAAAPGQARLDAAAALAVDAPAHAAALAAALERPRASTDEARRVVLARHPVDVASPDGKFKVVPAPRLKKGQKPPPEPDWLALLAADPDTSPETVDCFEVVALLRALAAARAFAAGEAVLAFAFTPDGVTFRDEAGRQLRAMSPWSLPALLLASQDKKAHGGSLARYSTFQLDKMDKNRPSYALAAAPDDVVEVAVLEALGAGHHPDAVQAVLDRCDATSPQVRRAARAAWMAYVDGPPPPPAPKAKRKLPGGKMSDEELPLYLTYRELARQELIRKLTELGQETLKKESELELTLRLFELLDARRSATWDQTLDAARALAGESKWAEAAAKLDEILVHEPLYRRRAEMAPIFQTHGEKLAEAGEWQAAVIAFEKALSLDPAGAGEKTARAALHFARAQVLRAAQKPAEDELALTLAADPNHAEAKKLLTVERRAAVVDRRGWMLYAGLGGAAAAVLLAFVGLWMRRRA